MEKILKAGYVDNDVFYESDKGTPQGGLLSPLLANIALTGMENYLGISYRRKRVNKNNGVYETFIAKGNYRMTRYADDFMPMILSYLLKQKMMQIEFMIFLILISKKGV